MLDQDHRSHQDYMYITMVHPGYHQSTYTYDIINPLFTYHSIVIRIQYTVRTGIFSILSKMTASGTTLPVTRDLLAALKRTVFGWAATSMIAILTMGNSARRFLKYSRYQKVLRSDPSTSTFLPSLRAS